MDIKEICNAGGDILDAVADAVNRNDYSGLSENVGRTVNRLAEQIKADASGGTYGSPTHRYGQTVYTREGQKEYRRREQAGRYDSIYRKKFTSAFPKRESYYALRRPGQFPAAVNPRPAGRIMGPVQLAWGILGTSGFGIVTLIMFILLCVMGDGGYLALTVIFGALTAYAVSAIVRGSRRIRLVNRFYRYARLIGNRGYIAVSELAQQTGRRPDDIVRDLKKMVQKRMFLQGRMDERGTTFILTDEAYGQYLQAETARKEREAAEAAYRKQQEELQKNRTFDAETKRILADGNAYIRRVNECSRQIKNEEMAKKTVKLEAVMRRIFTHVEKHPESAEDLHKFMDYYLPTTTKLLNAYIDMESQEIAGENITATKREIESTLDTINLAFEKLLDGLFEDTAWDISSDISVMKTMMAQEGLTENNDFKKPQE